MNILMISTNNQSLPVPVIPVGACMVSEAAVRAGHRVRFLDLMFDNNPFSTIEEEIKKSKPDVAALSIRNIDNNEMSKPAFFLRNLPELIRTIRRRTDAPIVIGGAAVSVMPEEILRFSGADYSVVGNGDIVFPQLLSEIEHGNDRHAPGVARIEGTKYLANSNPQQALPSTCLLPDFHRWFDVNSYISRLATVPLQTKTGCDFNCIYCTYGKIEGNEYCLHSPRSVAEVVKAAASTGIADIEIVDNVFNSPYEHAVGVCEELARIDHSVRLQTLELNPFSLDDTLVATMEKAGFVAVGMTAESASDQVLERLRKGFSAADVYHAAEILNRHSLPCLWIFMIGGPGETKLTVEETFEFIEKAIRQDHAVLINTGIRIYPDTELATIARDEGIISWGDNLLEPKFYISPELDPVWLQERIRDFRDRHMNVIGFDSLDLPFLPLVHRLGYRLGARSPIWRHTSKLRRGLKFLGIKS